MCLTGWCGAGVRGGLVLFRLDEACLVLLCWCGVQNRWEYIVILHWRRMRGGGRGAKQCAGEMLARFDLDFDFDLDIFPLLPTTQRRGSCFIRL